MSALQETPPERIRVLVADDEPSILETYREILMGAAERRANHDLIDLRARLFGTPKSDEVPYRERFELVTCEGAESAVRAVRDAKTGDNPFAVVFLDMRMPPGPDGVWAAARIRELDPIVDIVVVTAYSDIDPTEIGDLVPSAGNLFYLQKPFHTHEVRQLAVALGQRRRAEDRVRQLAYFDDITGLPNRALFRERLTQSIELAQRHVHTLALLYLDLDNFKRVNDTLGHSIGDILLSEIAKRLLTNLRSSDAVVRMEPSTTTGEIVARLGGDEFTVVLTDLRESSDAGVVAVRLLKALSGPINLAGQEVTVSASIGIAIFPDDGTDSETLLKSADMAMYFAKRAGRGGFEFHDEAMNAAALRRMSVESNLRLAIERGELAVRYQPQIDVATGMVVGVEALARWTSVQLGEVSPTEFIPIAEDTGLILPIGEWVLRVACAQCKAWNDEGIPLRMAVNVSVRQFAQHGFPALIANILEQTGLDPANLELEITESVLLKEGNAALGMLEELKRLGVKLAIDDFGTGYSSLSYLRQFPIDHLKIDRAFMCDNNSDPQDCAIATAVIAMGHSMNLRVTAEGVESEGQLRFLSERHCNEAQGFYVSHPMPASEASKFLRRHLDELAQPDPLPAIPASSSPS